MILYVESNFVLQLIWKQESFEDAQTILTLAQQASVSLAIPAIAMIEPAWTLENRNQQRRNLLESMNQHLRDLRRSQAQAQISSAILNAKEQFESVIPLDTMAFEDVLLDISRISRVIEIEKSTIEYALRNPYARTLRFLDAIVWASVRRDLDVPRPDQRKLFVTTNSKDFGTREIKEELKSVSCDIVHSFPDAVNMIRRFGN